MKIVRRGAGLLLVLALLINISALLAQDDDTDNTIDIAGSRLVISDIVEPLVITSGIEGEFNYNVTGTVSGFQEFCNGAVEVTGASRAITTEEEALCDANGVSFAEFLLGYDAMVAITHPDLDFVTCLSTTDLNTIFAPSAQGQITTWADTGLADATDMPIVPILPIDTSSTFAQLDNLIDGFGIRQDARVNVNDVVAEVRDTPGALGITTFQALGDAEGVNVLELNVGELAACTAPSVETFVNRQYSLADRLLLYVNEANLQDSALISALTYITSSEATPQIAEAGFTTPTDEAISLNQDILAGDVETGRQFSRDVVAFEIPANLIGSINIAGSANIVNYMNRVISRFGSSYPSVTVELDIAGEAQGVQAFCNGSGSIEFLSLATPLSEEDAQRCADNNVELLTYPLGQDAVVLVGNMADDYASCLTADQIVALWGAPATDTVVNWSDADAALPDVEFFTIAPSSGSVEADVLLSGGGGPILPLRSDATEINSDPLYRAAAVANVPGTLTFMRWSEYQEVLENEQTNIQLVSIDAGNGCVAPDANTIMDGTYPYASSSTIGLDKGLLTRSEVRSFIWFMFSDENYSLLEDAGYTGIAANDLPAIREELQNIFDEVGDIEPPTAAPSTPLNPSIPEFDPLRRPTGTDESN